jgi:hypothetical protein
MSGKYLRRSVLVSLREILLNMLMKSRTRITRGSREEPSVSELRASMANLRRWVRSSEPPETPIANWWGRR